MQYKIAIFASGTGTNTANLIERYKNSSISVGLIVTNNPKAGVIDIAVKHEIPFRIITKEDFLQGSAFHNYLKEKNYDLIVLAGFLWLIPVELISFYDKKIVNIHPALLPKYGGKGMYGMKVHRSVKQAGEKKTGITIHYVNENYDEGNIVFQKEVEITQQDTPDEIAAKVHQLEYKYFPEVIKKLLHS